MADLGKISFSSGYRYERVAIKGSTTFSVGTVFPATVPTITVAHNLGYSPYFKAFYTYGSGKYYQLFAGPGSYNLEGNGVQIDNIYVDSSNLVITLFGATNVTTITGTIEYRLYAEPQ